MNIYKALDREIFKHGEYSLVPIRSKDRYSIMQWRNDQIYHLRQDKPLTKEQQDHYFDHVISDLFNQKNPKQFLFSFLRNNQCIGYGGLVHINWVDFNAEVSFIMKTDLEHDQFKSLWTIYLSLIEILAFEEIKLHKLFVYAFDLRPHLYEALEQCGYFQDARLKEHCCFNEEFIDVVIHSKLRPL